MAITAVQENAAPQTAVPRKEWSPHIWQGCDFLGWMALLARNRFAVNWRFWYVAAIATVVSLMHTLLRCIQQAVYGRRVARTSIKEAPIFIIGHWRTGTTFLHELLILDERHTYPSTYECFEPNHFLLTEWLFKRWFWFLMPAHRPMDNMAAGWERPQEDEFALCMMGQPSPYLTIGFPNHGPQHANYLDLEGLSPRALAAWKKTFLGFLRRLTFKDPRRLVLKSPPHTCRIRVLLEMFPDARFVHIMRDPYVVFPSTVKLWKSLYETQGLQKPTFAGLDEYVFETYQRMYERLEEGRRLIAPGRFVELKYEDLVRDPVSQMRAVYEGLQLGGFDQHRPRLEAYLQGVAGYERNRYNLTPALRDEITRRWGPIIRRYGYAVQDS
jgi:hypothetical protein